MSKPGRKPGHLDPDKDILLAWEGRPNKFPIDLHFRLEGVPGVFRAVRQARLDILANRHEGAAKDLTQDLYKEYGDEYVVYAMLRAGHYAARRRLDYWGIKRVGDWWCSYCKQVKSINKFEGRSVAICHDCRESRAASRKRTKKTRLRYSERVKNG